MDTFYYHMYYRMYHTVAFLRKKNAEKKNAARVDTPEAGVAI